MALEPHPWEPAHFGGNMRQDKDAYAALAIDARSASSQRQGARGGRRQEERRGEGRKGEERSLAQTKGVR